MIFALTGNGAAQLSRFGTVRSRLAAGAAARASGARPGAAGVWSPAALHLRGLWFVRGNVVRDLAAHAKRELLPWDGWGLMETRDDSTDAELALLDRVAMLTQRGDEQHDESCGSTMTSLHSASRAWCAAST
jgi:hypothetical protein